MPKPNFPFGDRIPFPSQAGMPSVPMPWLGGMVVPISAGAANVNRPVDHGLNSVPRYCDVLDIGQNVAFPTPLPRGTTAWNTKQAFLNVPSLGQTVILFFG